MYRGHTYSVHQVWDRLVYKMTIPSFKRGFETILCNATFHVSFFPIGFHPKSSRNSSERLSEVVFSQQPRLALKCKATTRKGRPNTDWLVLESLYGSFYVDNYCKKSAKQTPQGHHPGNRGVPMGLYSVTA